MKKDAVTGVEEENERDETYKADNPQIDSSRTKYNYHLATPSGRYLDVIESRIAELHLKRKVRSDAVYLGSFVLGASPEFFRVSTTGKQYAFFCDCVKFFKDKYGEESVLTAVEVYAGNAGYGQGKPRTQRVQSQSGESSFAVSEVRARKPVCL